MIYSNTILHTSQLETPLGTMLIIADQQWLYCLKFVSSLTCAAAIARFQNKHQIDVTQGKTAITDLIEDELQQYFQGTLKTFTTPVYFAGSSFEQQVWQELQNIAFGKTISYKEQATLLSKPTAFRAVAQANSLNEHAIIIPCHRVINADGKIGGYNGGIHRKQWLLNHEAKAQQT